jgi:alcohol dehydrogenase class IV
MDSRSLSIEEAFKTELTAIRELSQRVGIPSGFSEFKIGPGDIECWIESALKYPCTPSNPETYGRRREQFVHQSGHCKQGSLHIGECSIVIQI